MCFVYRTILTQGRERRKKDCLKFRKSQGKDSAKFVLVVGDGLPDDGDGILPALHVSGHGLLALQRLVDGEEVGHFVKDVVGQLGDVMIGVVSGVGKGDGDDLFVVLAVVQHGDVAHGVAAHQRQESTSTNLASFLKGVYLSFFASSSAIRAAVVFPTPGGP